MGPSVSRNVPSLECVFAQTEAYKKAKKQARAAARNARKMKVKPVFGVQRLWA